MRGGKAIDVVQNEKNALFVILHASDQVTDYQREIVNHPFQILSRRPEFNTYPEKTHFTDMVAKKLDHFLVPSLFDTLLEESIESTTDHLIERGNATEEGMDSDHLVIPVGEKPDKGR